MTGRKRIIICPNSANVAEKNANNEILSSSFIKSIYTQLHRLSGVWYMIAGCFIFICCTIVLKLIPADMFDITIVRFLVQSIIFGTFATFYKHHNVFNTNGQPFACAANIIMSSVSNLTTLAAFYFLPLSDVNIIKYTYIVWAAILSVIFLKERFKIVNALALFLTCVGLLLATKPHSLIKALDHIFHQPTTIISNGTIINSTTMISATAATTSPYYYLGIGLASSAALARAIQMTARKQLLKTKLPHSVMNFHFTTAAFFVSLTYSIIRRFWQPGPYPWKWMGTAGVVIGCCQSLAVICLSKALKRESVQLVSIVGSLDIVFAVILQYIFFRQTKSWIFYIGALLIISSSIILSVDSYLTNKRQCKEQTKNENTDEKENKI